MQGFLIILKPLNSLPILKSTEDGCICLSGSFKGLITIFPDYFAPLKLSLFGKAQEAGLVEVEIHRIRYFLE